MTFSATNRITPDGGVHKEHRNTGVMLFKTVVRFGTTKGIWWTWRGIGKHDVDVLPIVTNNYIHVICFKRYIKAECYYYCYVIILLYIKKFFFWLLSFTSVHGHILLQGTRTPNEGISQNALGITIIKYIYLLIIRIKVKQYYMHIIYLNLVVDPTRYSFQFS